ncbi:MAG TPA: expansin EXLX1 family cellulose-binding protein, partial [Rugosimonospora sp.]|nr:expansin EXLX1 family cellulose-binding protein [Rugosimonospora sp.]
MAEQVGRTARHRSPVTVRWRWVAGGGAAVLAAILGVAVLLQTTGGPACAALPAASAGHAGIATFYTPGGGTGNCSFPSLPADGLYVALSPPEYAAAGACGGYLDVTGRTGTVRVKVVDQCPGCAAGHLDLSRQAFARIDDPVRGQVPIRYTAVVNPQPAAALSFVVKTGSSQYWLAILVDGAGNPLSTVEVKVGGGWQALARQDYDYWLAAGGAGKGPFTLRVTDTYGHQVTASGIGLSPGTVQRSTAHLYGPGAGTAGTTKAAPSPAARRTPAAP